MKIRYLMLFFFVKASLFSQSFDPYPVLESTLRYVCNNNCYSDLIYLEQKTIDTYFDKKDLVNQTISGKYLSKKDLKELKNSRFKVDILNSDLISKLSNHIIKLRQYNEVQQCSGVALSVSNPLFNLNNDHCVITVVESYQHGSFISNDYFLVKIYNQWIVLEVFNSVMS